MAARKPKVSEERAETCKSCRFCHHVKEAIECRRHPPTVTYDGSTGFYDYRFPEVAVIQWCGEYAPNLSS